MNSSVAVSRPRSDVALAVRSALIPHHERCRRPIGRTRHRDHHRHHQDQSAAPSRPDASSRRRRGSGKRHSLSFHVTPDPFLAPTPGLPVGVIANTVVYVLGNRVLLKGLALDGYVSSYVLGCLSYAAFGPCGYLLVCIYFLIGSYVTKLKMDVKEKEGTAEARGGRRGVGSVLGSGLAGLACAAAVLLGVPSAVPALSFEALKVGFTASFCSKLSDTVSSEVGKAYGKTTYLATTLKKVARGTEGAVSLEGTVAGVVASLVLGACGFVGGLVDGRGLVCVIAASVVANYLESLVGAGVQRGGAVPWLTNDVVNMLQISVASVLGIWLYVLV